MIVTTKNGYTLTLQIQPFRSYITTIQGILIMNASQSYRSTFCSQREIKETRSIEWKIVRKVFCDAKSNYCLLCLKEKHFIIIFHHEEILLNKRSELISKIKCRYENKNILANIGNSGKMNNDSID